MPPRHAPDMSYRPSAKADWNTIRTLLPYLWPRGEWTIRARVVVALLCLITAKLATVMVPVLYKEAVDLISAEGAFVVTALVGILIGYGISRVAQQGFAELQALPAGPAGRWRSAASGRGPSRRPRCRRNWR